MNKTTLVIIGIVVAPIVVCFAISLLNILGTSAEKPLPTPMPTPTRITISMPRKTPLAGWTQVPGNPLISYRVIPLSTPTRKP
jgi:hypothetical protein